MNQNNQLTKLHKNQGLWNDIPKDKWNDWIWQLKNRITSIAQLKKYITLTPQEQVGCEYTQKKLALAITPYYFNLIDINNIKCPIRLQVIPREKELVVTKGEMIDPVGEEKSMKVKGLVHRYPDRVLLLVTDRCASYCRYCTRSRLVSNAQNYNFHPNIEEALQYIAKNKKVRDVLLSGGDPLLLSNQKIDYILSRLRAIKHVEFVRIGSRVPIFLPQRITLELCNIFKKWGPIWLSIHTNHPSECTKELYAACEKLSFAGVPLGNQSVLLKGINDNTKTMRKLIHKLIMMRVRPYYLYQCDLITGSKHFRVSVKKGIKIIKELRGHTTGYAIPQYIIDAPGGGGKIPINPNYIKKITNNEIILQNYEDNIYSYSE